ncbi:MAG: hypothetical protein PWQ82_1195 [Thermosediminibacterales bacterium]|nr:hypothetical protein [Thermosediminibacterales bacterium]MDK2836221.1 hypothetical protein [Thermosediminibacterales bacterium]
MYYKIGLHLKKSKITALLCTKNIIWENFSLENFSDIFYAIKKALKELLNKSGVNPGKISHLNIAVDFGQLVKKGVLPRARIGYLQIGTKPIHDLKPEETFGPELKELIITSEVSESNNLSGVLKHFQEAGVEIVVTNTKLSLDNIEEKNLLKKIGNLCRGKFKVMTGESFADLGFIRRENTLLYNGLLIKGTEKFFSELSNICNSLGLYCNIYCLTTNGTLMSMNRTAMLPVKTINSPDISWLVGICNLEQLKNCLVIRRGDSYIYIAAIRNGVPQISPFPYSKENLKLNISHPNVLKIPVTSEKKISSAVKENVFNALKRLNLQDEFLPIVLAGIPYEEFPELFYSNVVFPVHYIYEGIAGAYGAASALLEVESNKILVYKKKKETEIENLWQTLYRNAEQEGIDLEQEVYKYLKETPLRYLSDEASLVQAILYGNLKYGPYYTD